MDAPEITGFEHRGKRRAGVAPQLVELLEQLEPLRIGSYKLVEAGTNRARDHEPGGQLGVAGLVAEAPPDRGRIARHRPLDASPLTRFERLDPLTGKVHYEGARVPPQNFMASPVAFDGKLLVVGMDGDAHLIKAGPVHEIVRTNSMGQPVAASPAIAGGRLYIRGDKELFCIEG